MSVRPEQDAMVSTFLRATVVGAWTIQILGVQNV